MRNLGKNALRFFFKNILVCIIHYAWEIITNTNFTTSCSGFRVDQNIFISQIIMVIGNKLFWRRISSTHTTNNYDSIDNRIFSLVAAFHVKHSHNMLWDQYPTNVSTWFAAIARELTGVPMHTPTHPHPHPSPLHPRTRTRTPHPPTPTPPRTRTPTKVTFFHLIYRSFESDELAKCMFFISVLTLLMYAGKLNKYEINYFVLFFVHVHVLIQRYVHAKSWNI